MRLIGQTVILLALLGVTSLVALPLLAGRAAEHADTPVPDALPQEPKTPEERDEPVVPVEELHEALRLPRVDATSTDEHGRASLAAYRAGHYEEAFQEAVLSLDPTPLKDNELYEVLTITDPSVIYETVEKSNGRQAIRPVDEALQPILEGADAQLPARLNNAAAMMMLRDYSSGTSHVDYAGLGMAQELAYQAADIDHSYCPALLNLTLLDGVIHIDTSILDHAGTSLSLNSNWTNYYPSEGCEDPALLYYRAQNAISGEEVAPALRLADELGKKQEWAGLAHSVRGDAYYWHGVYNLERTNEKKPFTARRDFRLALREYDAALALQPDDEAIRHGRALANLELGEVDAAIREAEAALEKAPGSPRLRETLIKAYEANGDYATAARLERELASERMQTPRPVSLVPYSSISHGADRYSELWKAAQGAVVLLDDEVIPQFYPTALGPDEEDAWSISKGLDRYDGELLLKGLLRDDLLSGDSGAFREDMGNAPEGVRRGEYGLFLAATDRLLDQPEGSTAPVPETRAAIEDFLARYSGYSASAGKPEPRADDAFYLEASNLFRRYEQYGKAVRVYKIWRTQLEPHEADAARRAEVESLLGEALFLDGQPEEALMAFERAVELRPDWPPYVVRQAFMHEKLEEYDEAADLYRRALEDMQKPAPWTEGYDPPASFYSPDNYQAAKHLGDVLLKQAADDEEAQGADSEEVLTGYEKAAGAYREALKYGNAQSTASAANNLGSALVKAGDYDGGIEALKTLVGPSDVPSTWQASPTPDEHNPVFRLNLGWAYERKHEEKDEQNDELLKLAAGQYREAIKSDPTFYPALNDLGILAAKEGRLEEAKGYFRAALDVKPDYDHAAHNLGVALVRSGPRNFLAGQGYFARAARQNPALAEASYDYIFDNELYFLKLSLGTRVPPDWQFATHAEKSTVGASLLALFLLLARGIFGYTGSEVRENLIEKGLMVLRRFGTRVLPKLSIWLPRLRVFVIRFMRLGLPTSGSLWMTPLALLISIPAITVVEGWSLLWGDSEAKWPMLVTLLYLVAVSLLVHHAGHALAALWFGIRVREAPWPAGIFQAIALIAIGGPALAPMPAGLAEQAGEREREKSLVYLAGPLASMLFALMLFVLFVIGHVPLLRLGAVLNLAMATVSMLLLPPLDAAMVSRGRYARWLLWVGLLLVGLSVLVSISNQLFCLQNPGDYCWDLHLEPG